MDLNEFLVINKKTKLDDLNIIINELNILISLYQKAILLKKLAVKDKQYKNELSDLIKFKSGAVNVEKFMRKNGDISLIELYSHRPFMKDEDINHKLSIIFYADQRYWNNERKEEFKAKILVIDQYIDILSSHQLYLFLYNLNDRATLTN